MAGWTGVRDWGRKGGGKEGRGGARLRCREDTVINSPLELWTQTFGPTHQVGEVTPESPRSIFGEMALWTRKPRKASAVSLEPCKVSHRHVSHQASIWDRSRSLIELYFLQVLCVTVENFPYFMALLPDMEAMFSVGQVQYAHWIFSQNDASRVIG